MAFAAAAHPVSGLGRRRAGYLRRCLRPGGPRLPDGPPPARGLQGPEPGVPLAVAASAGGVANATPLLAAAALYGAWVALVSTFARAEDGEAELVPAIQSRLLLACACTFPIPALALGVVLRSRWAGLWERCSQPLLLLGSELLAIDGAGRLSRERVEAVVGSMLRRLLVLTASMALVTSPLGSAGLPTALLVLGGYPLAARLRRLAPPS